MYFSNKIYATKFNFVKKKPLFYVPFSKCTKSAKSALFAKSATCVLHVFSPKRPKKTQFLKKWIIYYL